MNFASEAPAKLLTGPAFKALRQTPYWLTFNRPSELVTIGALGVSPIIAMTVTGDGPNEVAEFGHVASENPTPALLELFVNDGRGDIPLQSSGVKMDTIAGDGINPYRLCETLFINELQDLKARITNLSEESLTVRFAAMGGRNDYPSLDASGKLALIRATEKNRLTYPFFYVPDDSKISLAANGASESSIALDLDYDFELFQLSAVSSGTYTINVRDSNTGEPLILAPQDGTYEIDSRLLFGTGKFPMKYHCKHLFRAGQKIIINVTDTSGEDNTIYPTFAGRKVAQRLWRVY